MKNFPSVGWHARSEHGGWAEKKREKRKKHAMHAYRIAMIFFSPLYSLVNKHDSKPCRKIFIWKHQGSHPKQTAPLFFRHYFQLNFGEIGLVFTIVHVGAVE